MEEFATIMGKRIRDKRKECGLKQDEVAEKMMIKRETYNTIENGKRPLRDFEIVSLAKILNTTTDYILREVETQHVEIAAETGLNNDAISKLTDLNNKASANNAAKEVIDGLNMLLASEAGQSLIASIYEYASIRFKEVGEYRTIPIDDIQSAEYIEEDSEGNSSKGLGIVFKTAIGEYIKIPYREVGASVFLRRVDAKAKALRDEIQGSGAAKKSRDRNSSTKQK